MIELYDGWAIDADEHQFILGTPKKRAVNGAIITEMTGATYHPSLEMALRTFARARMRELVRTHVMTIFQALSAFADIEQRIRDIATVNTETRRA